MTQILAALVAAAVALGLGLAYTSDDPDPPRPVRLAPPPPPPLPLPPDPPPKAHACRAFDEAGVVIAWAESDQSSDCRAQIRAAVIAARCNGTARRVRYEYQRDALKPTRTSASCR